MKIRVGNQYLEFEDDIEVEKQFKLFESISDTVGDFSYSFDVPSTSSNRSVFNLYSINQTPKSIYTLVPSTIETDSGTVLYNGYVRVDRNISANTKFIQCSFFSGNFNWIAAITGKLSDIDFTDMNEDYTVANVVDKFDNTTGLIYPIINTGVFTDRSYQNFKLEDFHPFIYLHTVISRLFDKAGLKLAGELLDDIRYQRIIMSSSKGRSNTEEIENRTVYVGTETIQTYNRNALLGIDFELTTDPYKTGTHENFRMQSQYMADLRMIVDIEWILNFDTSTVPGDQNAYCLARVFINDVEVLDKDTYTRIKGAGVPGQGVSIKYTFELMPGDYVELVISTIVFADDGPTDQTIDLIRGSMRATPTRLYYVTVPDIIPDVASSEFLAQVFSMFNTVVWYDPFTKTVTADFLRSIKQSIEELDISNVIHDSIEDDYSEFIGTYGRYATLMYAEPNNKKIEDYNNLMSVPYAAHQIDTQNEFETEETDVLGLDIVSVYEDAKNGLGSYLPKLEYREANLENEIDITSVVDDGEDGDAEFTGTGFKLGDLIRISNSTVPSYNGDWIVIFVSDTSFRVRGLPFLDNATLKASRILVDQSDDSDITFLIAVPNVPLNYFSTYGITYIDLEEVTGNVATAYFLKPTQGFDIDSHKHTLAFGLPELPNMHQITMYTDYWQDFAGVLRDPLKRTVNVLMRESDFMSLKPTTKIRLTVGEDSASFYISRITGYKGSNQLASVELIKIP